MRKKTRRKQFLDEMSMVVPWLELEALVRSHYPKGGNGRLPGGPERDASGGEDWGAVGADCAGAASAASHTSGTSAALLETQIEDFLKSPELSHELFGPSSLIIRYQERAAILEAAEALDGHLTATVIGNPKDLVGFRSRRGARRPGSRPHVWALLAMTRATISLVPKCAGLT